MTEADELVARLRSARANGDPKKYIAMITVDEAHRIADLLARAPITEAVAPSRRDVANAINLARYGGFPGGLPPRDIEFEDSQSREYAYRLADAALALFPPPAHPLPQGEAEPADGLDGKEPK